LLTTRIATDLESARIAAGLSVRELARQLRVDRERIQRALRGEANALTFDLGARLAAALGLELSASLHAEGAPVRDKGHLALLERLRVRLSLALRWRTEVPIPITGDRRSADAVISGAAFEILVEAETTSATSRPLSERSPRSNAIWGANGSSSSSPILGTTAWSSAASPSFGGGFPFQLGHAWPRSPLAGIPAAMGW
jgi:transcriptional regulator with XRE-family HTH domain